MNKDTDISAGAEEGLLRVATVRSIQPLRRELCLTPAPEHAQALHGEIECLWVKTEAEGRPGKHRVLAWKGTEDAPIAVLGPGTPQDMVATFKGLGVYAAEEDLLEPEDAVSEVNEWIGFAVVGEGGEKLGTVSQTFATAMNAAVQVEQADGKRFSFPAIGAVVLSVDLDKGEITVGDLGPYRVDDED